MEKEYTREPAAGSTNQDIMELLIFKLSQRGLLCRQIPRFIRDVLLAVRDSGHKSAAALNQRLDILGWGKQILDEFTLQLILFVAENRNDIRIPSVH